MLGLIVALFACVPLPPDGPSARALAEGLASPRAEDRFAAIDAIESLGLKGLPTLREVAATAPAEVREIASELIDRIGARRLLRPTRATLGPGEKTVGEAVAALRDQTGFLVDLPAQDEAKLAARPVAIEASGPIGFFEAIDRIGASGGLRHDPGTGFVYPPRGGIRVRLAPFDGPAPPTSYPGPYRVVLAELLRHRVASQAKKPAESFVREEFTATLDVEAEPGILIDRAAPIRILEAIDDRGRDLRAAIPAGNTPMTGMRPWGQESLGSLTIAFPMRLPEDRGKRIARLRGVVPITALARTDEMFSAPIERIAGRVFAAGGATVRIHRADLTGAQGTMEIAVKGTAGPASQMFAPGPRQASLATLRLPFNPDDHLRIEDADGNAYFTSSHVAAPLGPDGVVTYRVTLFPNRPLKPPAKLRFFGVAGVATELPFDFRDLPIP